MIKQENVTVPQQSYGGGITSAFKGLMTNSDPTAPGDGEGQSLDSVGTVTFSCLIILLAFKVSFFRIDSNWMLVLLPLF